MDKDGGEDCIEAGGDGRTDCGFWLMGEGGAAAAFSKYFENRDNLTCHSAHCSFDAKRLYRMLLRNSTSMTWISLTDIPDTSAHVLFV